MKRFPSGSFRHQSCPGSAFGGGFGPTAVDDAGVSHMSAGPLPTTSDLPTSAVLGIGESHKSGAVFDRETAPAPSSGLVILPLAIFAVVTAAVISSLVPTEFAASSCSVMV